jgi:hypothetical protein
MKRWQVGMAIAYAQGYIAHVTDEVDLRDVRFLLEVSGGAVTIRFDDCIPDLKHRVHHVPAHFCELLMQDIGVAQGTIEVRCRDTTQGPNDS